MAFITAVAVNSIAAVTPHMEGEGCSVACCQAARKNEQGSSLSRLLCLMGCNQPGGAPSPSPASSILSGRQKDYPVAQPSFELEAIVFLRPEIVFDSQSLNRPALAQLYLKTGTFLI